MEKEPVKIASPAAIQCCQISKQGRDRIIPLFGVLLKAFHEDLFYRDLLLAAPPGDLGFFIQDCVVHILYTILLEGCCSDNHFEQKHADLVDVCPWSRPAKKMRSVPELHRQANSR